MRMPLKTSAFAKSEREWLTTDAWIDLLTLNGWRLSFEPTLSN